MHDFNDLRQTVHRRRWDLLVGLLLGAAGGAVVAWMAFHLVTTDQLKAQQTHLPTPVDVLPAKVVPLRVTVGASGIVQPELPMFITARDSARVLQVPVDLGSVVKRDDLLVELDARLFEAALQSAKVAADHLDKQVVRMETLEAHGYGSPADTEKARTDAAAAHQAVVSAQIDLENTRVTSPAAAVVITRTVNPGETTSISEPLFELGTIENVLMEAEVSEDKIGFVHLGMQSEVGTDAFPGETFRGEVVKIEARVLTATRTFNVYIRVPNSDLRLKPGVTGYARIISSISALAVTSTSILNPVEDHPTVFVVDKDNVAHIRQIRRGIMAEGLTQILDGLVEGDRVVTVGQLELHDGEHVRVSPSAPWNK